MTIRQLLKKYSKIEIELLLAHVLRKPKEFVFLNPEKKLSSYQVIKLSSLLRRRMKGEPIAYILGYKDFYGLRFKVNKNVLIPRPETEAVVDYVIRSVHNQFFQEKGIAASPDKALAPRNDNRLKILDIGTGSGCIIISLAKTFTPKPLALSPNLEFYASDVSAAALKVANQNANTHKVRVNFIKSDLLKNIKFNPDVIIANLPYLDIRWASKDLKLEPALALYAKKNGLELYDRLLSQVTQLKLKPKVIYLEFDPRQKIKLRQLIKKYLPEANVKFYRDYAKHWRYAEIFLQFKNPPL